MAVKRADIEVVGDLPGSSLVLYAGDIMSSVEAVARRPLAPFTVVVDGGAAVDWWR
jgi:hypothetical protein